MAETGAQKEALPTGILQFTDARVRSALASVIDGKHCNQGP